jgi:hypothetical protein
MKTWRNRIYALFMVLILSACSIISPPKPTPTPIPTNTPQPTDTPIPTSTATPVPTSTNTPTLVPSPTSTATPNIAATAAVRNTQTADSITADFKAQMNKVGISVDTGHMGWVQQEPLGIKMDSPGEALYSPFAEDINASDFILKTDVTWNATGILVCGWKFRSESNFELGQQYGFYFLRFSGLPAWDIELWNYGEPERNISEKVRFASALKLENGDVNKFIFVAEDNKFTVYINGERIGSFYDFSKTRSDGYFAIAGNLESGTGSCKYDNTAIWLLK